MKLFDSLQIIPDTRVDRCKKYPLDYILLIVFTASISGNLSWYLMHDYAADHHEDLKRLYEKLSGRECNIGIPSHDTLDRVIRLLDPKVMHKAQMHFLEEYVNLTVPEHLCIDGKTMRGVKKMDFDAECHCVSAYSPKIFATIAQEYISKKSNEINALKELLTILDLENTVVTIDAIGTQTELVDLICEKKGDYVLNVKRNQPHTLEEIEALFCPYFASHIQVTDSTDGDHGRVEIRRLESILAPLELEENPILSKWEKLRSVHKMTRTTTDKKTKKTTIEVAYYISSLEDCEEVFKLIREHWAVESMHYMLDVIFKEDQSLKRAGNAAQNMNIINKLNLTILQMKKKETGMPISRLIRKFARMKPSEIIEMKL